MKKIYFFFFLASISNWTLAQGDTPCAATTLTVNSSCTYTTFSNVGATDSGISDPGCASYNGADVWFSATVGSSGNLDIQTTQATGGFSDGGMAVYTGTCSSLTFYECDDDDSNGSIFHPGIFISDPALANQTVYIRVWEYGGNETGDFDICAYECSQPNDECADATSIPSATIMSGSTVCATPNAADDPTPAEVCAGSIENTIWYEFVAPTSGDQTITFSNYSCSSGSGIQVGVVQGGCGGPYTSLGCNDGNPPTNFTFTTIAGQTYLIAIDGNAGAECDFDIEITEICSFTNDDCATAQNLSANTGSDLQHCYNAICNNGASDGVTIIGSACGDVDGAVLWYEITTDAGDGLLDVEVTSSDFNPHILVWTDCSTPANGCDASSGSTATINAMPVSGSTTYYISVSQTAGIGEGEFNLCVTSYPNTCSPSDDCPGAGPTVFPALTSGTQSCLINECNVGATNPFDPTVPGTTTCGNIQGGLTWYQFTTNASDQLATIEVNSVDIQDPMITLWSDCSTYLTNVCASGTNGNAILQGYNAGSSTTILFTVTSSSGTQTGDFDICVTSYSDNSACNVEDTLIIQPASLALADANGNFLPGTTVQFCYELNKFRHIGSNYFHGVVPDFGSAWDQSTFNIISTPTPQGGNEICSEWNYFPAGTVNYNNIQATYGTPGKYPDGTPLGAGWFFRSVYSAGGPWDCTNINTLDPNDSWGDGCNDVVITGLTSAQCAAQGGSYNFFTGDCTAPCGVDATDGYNMQWEFCFEITTKANYDCSSAEDFTVSMETFADGETGGWDELGCIVDAPHVKNIPAPNPANINFSINSQTDVTCNGGSDGSVSISATGGYETLQYQLFDGSSYGPLQATGNFTNLTAGTYTIRVQDDILCQDSLSITINEPPVPSGPAATYNDPLCEGSDLDLTAVIGSYTNHSWTGPNSFTSSSATPTINNVTSSTHDGWYYVTADNADGCPTTPDSVEVVINPNPTSTNSSTSPTCVGESDGTATAVSASGTPPYSYDWDISANSQNNPTATSLAAGTYDYTITDSNGCENTSTATVTDPTPLSTTVTDASCNRIDDGVATAVVSGNPSNYTYEWTDPSSQTTQNAVGLGAGPYAITVTSIISGCQEIGIAVINEPPAIDATFSVTATSCGGASDGAATATPSGGPNTGSYSYLWDNGQTAATATNLTGGLHDVTITKAGCSDVIQVSITDQGAITVTTAVVSNASCNTGSDGEASVSASGGSGGFTYQWDAATGNQTGTNATNLTPGTYFVTATDATGFCTGVESITIGDDNNLPSASIAAASDLTCSASTVSLDASGSTGTGLTYSWSTSGGFIVSGGTTSSPTVNSAGVYTVTVTESNGCTDTESVTVSEDNTAPTVSVDACNATSIIGGTDGSIAVSASGTAGPFTYDWTPAPATGQTGSTATGLPSGSYNVTVTAANGCTGSNGCTVNDPGCAVTVSITSTSDVSCNGGTDGTATVTMNGGITPIAYSWCNSQSGQTSVAMSAGTCGVTVIDNVGCQGSATATIDEPNALNANTTVNQNVSCNGTSDGSATVNVNGGATPYVITWSSGGSGATVSNLSGGNHDITVTDNNTCSTTTTVSITEPATLSASVACSGTSVSGASDGSASATVTGGSTNYTYAWDNGQTGQTANNLPEGSISVIVTDANGCTVTDNCTVTDAPCAITVTTTVTDAGCNGASDGQIITSATGGITPYNYSWNTGQTTATITGLTSGNYLLSVSDASGCSQLIAASVSEPALIVSNIACSSPSVAGGSDGSSSVTPTGGASGYTYNWSAGSTTTSQNNLSAGGVSVTITDVDGCSVTDACTVTDPSCALIIVSTITDVNCNGASDGSIEADITGGVTPYSFSWSTGSTSSNSGSVAAGAYTVSGTDGAGCTVTQSFTVSEPTNPISTSVTVVSDETCGAGDGEATVSASGGTGTITFNWPGGLGSNANQSGLSAGAYDVTATDDNGCTAIATATIGSIGGPNATLTVVHPTCNGFSNGSATINATGGNSPLTYMWAPGGETISSITGLTQGNYDVTVANNDNTCPFTATAVLTEPDLITVTTNVSNATCFGGTDGSVLASSTGGTAPYNYIWCDGQTTSIANNLSTGACNVTVTDDNGCTAIESVTISSPSAIAIGITATDVNCGGASDGTINTTVSGGTTPYSYAWDPTGPTTGNLVGLGSGYYTVSVTDVNGCEEKANVSVSEPVSMSVTFNITPVSCYEGTDGVAEAIVTGGTTPISYAWFNGSTTSSSDSLAAGQTRVTITDGNGCTQVETTTITSPAELDISVNKTDASCGFANGVAIVNISGGTSGYSVIWSNTQTTQIVTGLSAGIISTTVTDVNGCSANTFVPISNPDPEPAVTDSANVSCFGANDAYVDMEITGGITPYSYNWENLNTSASITSIDGTSTSSVNGLSGGIYGFTVTDGTLPPGPCIATYAITVTEPDELLLAINETGSISCFGSTDGELSLAMSGGTTPYVFNWNTTDTNDTISNISAGVYSATLTDANGCVDFASITVNEPSSVVGGPDTMIFCQTSSGIEFMNGQPAGGTWTGTGGIVISPSGGLDVDASTLTGSGFDLLVYDVGGCTDTMHVDINGSIAGNDSTICSDDTLFNQSIGLPIGGYWEGPGLIDTSIGNINTTGLNGNVLYTYNSEGCRDTMILTVNQVPSSPSLLNDTVCFGDSILINIEPNGAYTLWYSDSLVTFVNNDVPFSPPVLAYDTIQSYFVVLVNNNCRSIPVKVDAIIDGRKNISFTASPDSGSAPLDVTFNNTSSGIDEDFDTYTWNFGTGDSEEIFETSYTYEDPGLYEATLIVEDYNTGCIDSSSVQVYADGASSLIIPTVFSPNGDGVNDEFTLDQENLQQLEVTVFNRWGELVFSWEDAKGGWDGTTFAGEEAPAGTYFVVINAVGQEADGTEIIYEEITSTLTLVRGN